MLPKLGGHFMGWNTTGLDHSNAVHLIGLFQTGFSIANTDHDGSRSNDPALYPEGLQFDSLAEQRVSVSFFALLSAVRCNASAVPQTRSLPHHVTWRSSRFSQRCCSRHGSYGMWLRKHTASHPERAERPSTSFPIHSNKHICSIRATNSSVKLLTNTAESIWETFKDRQTKWLTNVYKT